MSNSNSNSSSSSDTLMRENTEKLCQLISEIIETQKGLDSSQVDLAAKKIVFVNFSINMTNSTIDNTVEKGKNNYVSSPLLPSKRNRRVSKPWKKRKKINVAPPPPDSSDVYKNETQTETDDNDKIVDYYSSSPESESDKGEENKRESDENIGDEELKELNKLFLEINQVYKTFKIKSNNIKSEFINVDPEKDDLDFLITKITKFNDYKTDLKKKTILYLKLNSSIPERSDELKIKFADVEEIHNTI